MCKDNVYNKQQRTCVRSNIDYEINVQIEIGFRWRHKRKKIKKSTQKAKEGWEENIRTDY